METPSIAELEQHVAMLRDRTLQIASEIKALLAEDLPKFVEREIKRAFVGNPEFASTVDDATLRKLKSEIASRGAASAQRVLAGLEDDRLWFPESPGEDDPRKSIAENKALWDVVSSVAADVRKLMDDFGFPPADDVAYKPPSWFIGRRYLPSLSEKYWRQVRELAEAEAHISRIRTDAARSELSRRWDET